jgi:L-fucose isomerase-like protein
MNTPPADRLRAGFLAIGRKRPGFDPDWGRQMTAAAWAACEAAPFETVRPRRPVVDDATLRQAIDEFRQAGCRALLVLQPTMGDGRLAPILAQLWNDPLVLWATPERPEADRVTACSLVGAHVFASTWRQMHRPFELVYGHPDEPQTQEQLLTATRLTATAASLRRSKVALVGYHAPGFVNIHADPVALNDQLGVQLQHISLAEFQGRVEACDPKSVEHDVETVEAMQIPMDESLQREDLAANSRYYLAIRELIAEENLDALALRCWPELPNQFGHWPYLAMMRLTEQGRSIALEGDVDGALLGLIGHRLNIGTGYITDWLAHDESTITLWHPGHAPRNLCVPDSLRLGRHFNNEKPLVVDAELAAGRPVTLARMWRCDGRYRFTVFTGRTVAPQQRLAGAHGVVAVDDEPPVALFERLCHAGMPHHLNVFEGDHAALWRRAWRCIAEETSTGG